MEEMASRKPAGHTQRPGRTKKGLVNRPRTCPAAAQGCYTVVTAIGQELRSPASVYGHRPRASQSRFFHQRVSIHAQIAVWDALRTGCTGPGANVSPASQAMLVHHDVWDADVTS